MNAAPTPSRTRRTRPASSRHLGVALAWSLLLAAAAEAQDLVRRVESLSFTERQRLQQQRAFVAELARRHVGTSTRGSLQDLRILQTLVDSERVAPHEIWELQCLGVALGDVMASQLDLDWVMLVDRKGHSRALRYRDTDRLVFPVTMISKRVARGVPVDVRELFEKTAAEIRRLDGLSDP